MGYLSIKSTKFGFEFQKLLLNFLSSACSIKFCVKRFLGTRKSKNDFYFKFFKKYNFSKFLELSGIRPDNPAGYCIPDIRPDYPVWKFAIRHYPVSGYPAKFTIRHDPRILIRLSFRRTYYALMCSGNF